MLGTNTQYCSIVKHNKERIEYTLTTVYLDISSMKIDIQEFYMEKRFEINKKYIFNNAIRQRVW